MKLLLEIKVQVVQCQVMLQKIWKQHLCSGCQYYFLQVPTAPQKILFKWDGKGEGTELGVRISCNFFQHCQSVCVMFFSNFKFSDELDRFCLNITWNEAKQCCLRIVSGLRSRSLLAQTAPASSFIQHSHVLAQAPLAFAKPPVMIVLLLNFALQ